MSEELLVNVTPRETRVALVENGMLQELHIERGSQRGVVGNIYKGKVQRVMPGMQAAFVDIGLERAAFLHANDIFRSAPIDVVEGEDAPVPPPQVQIPITELLRDGAEIVRVPVQIGLVADARVQILASGPSAGEVDARRLSQGDAVVVSR